MTFPMPGPQETYDRGLNNCIYFWGLLIVVTVRVCVHIYIYIYIHTYTFYATKPILL